MVGSIHLEYNEEGEVSVAAEGSDTVLLGLLHYGLMLFEKKLEKNMPIIELGWEDPDTDLDAEDWHDD